MSSNKCKVCRQKMSMWYEYETLYGICGDCIKKAWYLYDYTHSGRLPKEPKDPVPKPQRRNASSTKNKGQE